MPKRNAHRLAQLIMGLPWPRSLRRFRRHQEGATAVEFALIAAPFLALLIAIIETGLVFFASQTLETAVGDAARLIKTGQAQTQKLSEQQFKDAICSRISGLFKCQSDMVVDVRCYSGFGGTELSPPLDEQGNLTIEPGFCPGKAGDIVVVRAMYPWPIRLSLLGFNLSNMAKGQRLIMATSTFRNEPYE